MLYWPSIEFELSKIPHVWDDAWTLETLQTLALDGMVQVWAVGPKNEIHMVVFTKVQTYASGKRFLSVFLSFGNDLDGCGELVDAALENYANSIGCYCIKVTGRPGWEKFGAKLGYKRDSVTLVKRLYGERRQ